MGAVGRRGGDALLRRLPMNPVPPVSPFMATVVDENSAAAVAAIIGAGARTTKLYFRDDAGTPHYWQVTVSALGALNAPVDVGTTAPTDGTVFTH